jgi:3-methylfumaryl-CoA hydratase
MTAVDPEAFEVWRGYIGRNRTETQTLDLASLRRFAAALGRDPATAATAPPVLAHWAWFVNIVGRNALSPDGHPKRGDFLPPVTLPRRMFASSDIQLIEACEIDVQARSTWTIADVRLKSGKSGDLVFVETERRIEQSDRVRVIERQTVVYREDGPPTPAVVPTPGFAGAVGKLWTPDAVDLFRFSAATFNNHRIHYDAPYATGVEGYPGLVVHGPFTAAMLADRAGRTGSVRRFRFRASAPMFSGQPILLRTLADGTLDAVRCDFQVAMSATAEYEGAAA